MGPRLSRAGTGSALNLSQKTLRLMDQTPAFYVQLFTNRQKDTLLLYIEIEMPSFPVQVPPFHKDYQLLTMRFLSGAPTVFHLTLISLCLGSVNIYSQYVRTKVHSSVIRRAPRRLPTSCRF